MAVVIRMKRTGRRNRPCYRISVADSRAPRDGITLETLGVYDPIAVKAESQHTLKVERARYWLGMGAKPSPTVHSIFKRHDVYEGDLALGLPKRKRDRSGRKLTTKTGEHRSAAKQARKQAKTTRRAERATTRRAAKKAAAVAASAGAEA
ncbi:MAG: 30S ribosomal protein S16 [Planctomycetota bacterium]